MSLITIASCIPSVRVADCRYNAEEISRLVLQASSRGARIVLFPELCITGYSCGDLLQHRHLQQEAVRALAKILSDTAALDVVSIVGLPLVVADRLLNVAAVLHRGRIMGLVPKCYLPNYKEFYEQRWFASAFSLSAQQHELLGQDVPISRKILFRTPMCTFGIELCEDLWAPIPPSSALTLHGAEVIFNLSATNECVGKHDYLCRLISQHSAQTLSAYVYSSCGFGESSTDVVFSGNAMVCENGRFLARSPRFSLEPQMVVADIDVERLRSERLQNTTFHACAMQYSDDYTLIDVPISPAPPSVTHLTSSRPVNPHPFIPAPSEMTDTCQEIFSIQCAGLAKRLAHTKAQVAVLGISGGLDSTLALLVCARTMDLLGWDRQRVVAVTMPGFGTTDRTYTNAVNLVQSLGCTLREISIREACTLHLADIGHHAELHDVVYENTQARERTQILMDLSNELKGLVVGTGDLSEMALGWCTYNGDHISMYAVNASIPKTLVRHLVAYVAQQQEDTLTRTTLQDIIDTPVSPELLPPDEQGNIVQCTEDAVGPYELHDFFLYHHIRYGTSPTDLADLAEKAFQGKYDRATILRHLHTFLRRFFGQQFKRSCFPDGPKVGSISLSPRGDWRMPSDASPDTWLAEIS